MSDFIMEYSNLSVRRVIARQYIRSYLRKDRVGCAQGCNRADTQVSLLPAEPDCISARVQRARS
jgi:hypothetical protein